MSNCNCNCIEKVVAAMKEVAAEWKRPELTDLAARIEVRAIKYAARRALEQAAEPGVERPAPARTQFDAKAWAENMVPTGPKGGGCGAQGTIRVHDFPDAEYSWNPFGVWPEYDRRYIAAALTAAHAAGRAAGDAAGYARGKAEGHTLGRIDERARLISLVTTAAPAAKEAHS